jgi:hypothetical protein
MCFQHNGLVYHACTTGNPHNRPAHHTLHNEHLHDGVGTTGFKMRNWPHHIEKGNVDHAPRTPNVRVQLPLRAAKKCRKTNDLVRAAVGSSGNPLGGSADRLPS